MKQRTATLLVFAVVAIASIKDAAAVCQITNSCQSSTSCTFQGLQNNALGAASLSITGGGGSITVSNIGTSGSDGVRILNPPAGFAMLGTTEPWEDLGYTANQPITGTGNNTSGKYTSTERLTGFGPAARVFEIDFTWEAPASVPGHALRIQPIYTTLGDVVEYTAYLGAVEQATVESADPAFASAWYNTQGFAVITWANTINLKLPDRVSVPANRLEIVPRDAGLPPTDIEKMEITFSNQGGGVPSFTLTAESFPNNTSVCVPALSEVGMATLVVLLLSAMAWFMWRRLPA